MVQCPRCGDVVDELHPLPVESVRPSGPGQTRETDAAAGRACSWCRHEILEG